MRVKTRSAYFCFFNQPGIKPGENAANGALSRVDLRGLVMQDHAQQ